MASNITELNDITQCKGTAFSTSNNGLLQNVWTNTILLNSKNKQNNTKIVWKFVSNAELFYICRALFREFNLITNKLSITQLINHLNKLKSV